MPVRVLVPFALLIGATALVSGCGNDSRPGAGSYSSAPVTSAPDHSAERSPHSPSSVPPAPTRALDTPVITGLPRRSRWSDPDEAVAVYGVGKSFAIVRSSGTIDFQDASTGADRGRARTSLTPGQRFQVTTWHGAPALLSWSEKITPSDGLSRERRTQVIEAFDPRGRRLARLSWPAGSSKTVENGWIITANHDDPQTATITNERGGQAHHLSCSGLACAFEVQPGRPATLHDNSDTPMPLLLGDLYFSHEHLGDMGFSALVAHDLRTGRRLWSTSQIRVPAGVADTSEVAGCQAVPVAAVGGQVLLSWVGPDTGILDGSAVLALHDASTGAVTVTGPTTTGTPDRTVIDPAAHIAVVAVGLSDPRSTAWSTRTGTTLWSQAEDEQPLAPAVAFGHTLLGYRTILMDGSEERPILVDLRNKHVIDADPANTSFTVSDGGTVAALVDEHVFAFESE